MSSESRKFRDSTRISDGVDFRSVTRDARTLYGLAALMDNGKPNPDVTPWDKASMDDRAPYVAAVMGLYARNAAMDDYIRWGHLPIIEARDTEPSVGSRHDIAQAIRVSTFLLVLMLITLVWVIAL